MLPVEVKVHESAGTIVINRPDKCNALSRQVVADLEQAFSDLHLERRVRAVILTGAGSTFCSGLDLAELHATSQDDDAMQQWHQTASQFRDLLLQMLSFPKPIIASVQGPALAGGLALVLACDLVVGCERSTVGIPAPRRGIVAGLVAPLLAFRLGAGQAARLLLSTETIDADEAHRLGILHEKVGAELTWARALELAQQCSKSAAEALQLTKQLLNDTVGDRMATMLTAGAAASAASLTTEAAQEGLASFVEKRPPQWPGRSVRS